MRRHPEIGYRILQTQPYLAQEAPIVLHHHERYDGKGYPKQLRANSIPLGARIVAVADAYDVMISHRPYHAPMTEELASAEILRERGGQFDPIVVDRFLSIAAERLHNRDGDQGHATGDQRSARV